MKALRISVVGWIVVAAHLCPLAAEEPDNPPADPGVPPAIGPADPAAAMLPPHPGACPQVACPSCVAGCAPAERCWLRAEYLLWWIKDGNLPPLVTTGSPADAVPGALGQPGTRVLFGDEDLDYGSFNGARFTAGTWLDDCGTHGIELGYFFLEEESDGFAAASSGLPGSPILARPFFDAATGTPSAEYAAFPGVAAGRIDVDSSSQLMGAELNGLCNLWCTKACGCTPRSQRADLIYGFRYLDLDEDLSIGEQVTLLSDLPAGRVFPNDPALAGTQFSLLDEFETQNRFYGGQLGMRWQATRGRAFLWLLGKVALGSTHQDVRISGRSVVTTPGGGRQVFAGGELAQPTNIGEYSRDSFSVVPEIGITTGYQVTDNLSLLAGYTFLYWSDVVRPGDQIDTAVNPTQRFGGALAGAPRPAFSFEETDFWAHGLSLGAMLQF